MAAGLLGGKICGLYRRGNGCWKYRSGSRLAGVLGRGIIRLFAIVTQRIGMSASLLTIPKVTETRVSA